MSGVAYKSHIVGLTFWAQGHIRPMIALSESIAERHPDCLISFAVPMPTHAKGEMPAVSCPSQLRVRRLNFDSDEPDLVNEHGVLDNLKYFVWLGKNESRIIEGVHEMVRGEPPVTVAIYDMMGSWGLPVGRSLGVRTLSFMCSPLSCMYLMLEKGLDFMSNPAELETAGHVELPDMCRLYTRDFPRLRIVGQLFQRNFERIRQCDGLIVNDCPTLYPPGSNEHEPRQLELLRAGVRRQKPDFDVLLTGLLATSALKSEVAFDNTTPEIAWLNTQADNSVIFCALGSWVQLPDADLCELAWGLAACNRPLLWAYRARHGPLPVPEDFPKDFKWRECTEVIDKDGFPEGFQDAVQNRTAIVPWVNQLNVLRHPAVGVFVTHCGWNSLSEAFALCGKPLVALPVSAEQPINAVIVSEYFKVGKQVWRDTMEERVLHRADVTDAVQAAFENEDMKVRAAEIKRKSNEYYFTKAHKPIDQCLHLLPSSDTPN